MNEQAYPVGKCRLQLIVVAIACFATVQLANSFLKETSAGLPGLITLCTSGFASIYAASFVSHTSWKLFSHIQIFSILGMLVGAILTGVHVGTPQKDPRCTSVSCFTYPSLQCHDNADQFTCKGNDQLLQKCSARFCSLEFEDCYKQFTGFSSMDGCETHWMNIQDASRSAELQLLCGLCLVAVLGLGVLLRVVAALPYLDKPATQTTASLTQDSSSLTVPVLDIEEDTSIAVISYINLAPIGGSAVLLTGSPSNEKAGKLCSAEALETSVAVLIPESPSPRESDYFTHAA